MNSGLEKWKPGVPKNILLLLAGSTWIVIGIYLIFLSYSWLKDKEMNIVVIMAFAGLFSAILIHTFGFSKIVNKNIQRIIPMDGKRCLFSFFPWRSYVLVSIMILTGSFIRHSPFPKIYLSVLYIGIGGAMILSGLIYIKFLIRLMSSKKSDFQE